MASILELYNNIDQTLKTNGVINRKVQTNLVRTTSDFFIQMMSKSDEGFCFTFIVKQKNYKDLMNDLSITENDLKAAFLKDWGAGAMSNRMHSNSYYQIYLLLLLYGIENNDKKIIDNSLICLLIRLWNGQKKKFIPFCNKDIMAYVVNYMTNKKHIINKYSNPLDMIQNYFVPTLLKKYTSNIKSKPGLGLKTIFEAAYNRIKQIFSFNPVINIKTGGRETTGGLRAMYMKAHDEGLSIKTIQVHQDEDNPATFADYISVNDLDDIIDKTVRKIITNIRLKYSDMFINNLYKDYGVKTDTIKHILYSIHNNKYKDDLQDIYSIILQQTNVKSKQDICSSKFTSLVHKHVLISKNSKEIKNLHDLIFKILDDIMKNYLKVKPLKQHSNNHLIQLRKLFVRALIYNLRSAVCN